MSPAICVAMFTRAVEGEDRAAKLHEAVRATAVIASLLAVAAVAGLYVLDLFGLSLGVFAGYRYLKGGAGPEGRRGRAALGCHRSVR